MCYRMTIWSVQEFCKCTLHMCTRVVGEMYACIKKFSQKVVRYMQLCFWICVDALLVELTRFAVLSGAYLGGHGGTAARYPLQAQQQLQQHC